MACLMSAALGLQFWWSIRLANFPYCKTQAFKCAIDSASSLGAKLRRLLQPVFRFKADLCVEEQHGQLTENAGNCIFPFLFALAGTYVKLAMPHVNGFLCFTTCNLLAIDCLLLMTILEIRPFRTFVFHRELNLRPFFDFLGPCRPKSNSL